MSISEGSESHNTQRTGEKNRPLGCAKVSLQPREDQLGTHVSAELLCICVSSVSLHEHGETYRVAGDGDAGVEECLNDRDCQR
jgi:hypothetical protein